MSRGRRPAPSRAGALALAITVLAALLVGCSSTGAERPTAPDDEPAAADAGDGAADDSEDAAGRPGVFYRRLTPAVRRELPTLAPRDARWRTPVESGSTEDGGRVSLAERRMPPCDAEGPWQSYAADGELLDFAQTVVRRGRFTVARHLALHPDADAARAFVAELGGAVGRDVDRDLACERIDGRVPARSEVTPFARDRSVGTRRPRATRVAGASVALGGGDALVVLDSVARRGNAVVLTRVVDPAPTSRLAFGGEEVVAALRDETDRGWALVDRLPAEPPPVDGLD